MGKNIVLLSGSPRKGGNTDQLAAAFIKGAEDAGKSVALFQVAHMNISGCMGCGACFEKDRSGCAQKDDMEQIYEALREADTLVLASPVYFFNVTAQLKLAVDRIYALLSDMPPIKRMALLMTCGAKAEKVGDAAVAMVENLCAYSKWEYAGTVTATSVTNIGDIKNHAALEKAAALGREI